MVEMSYLFPGFPRIVIQIFFTPLWMTSRAGCSASARLTAGTESVSEEGRGLPCSSLRYHLAGTSRVTIENVFSIPQSPKLAIQSTHKLTLA